MFHYIINRHVYARLAETTQTTEAAYFSEALPSARLEVSFLSQLNHPHVVKMFGVCVRPLCVVLELAPMGSLEKIIKAYSTAQWLIDAYSSCCVAQQVASALDYLHSTMNVIYRDLKSDNVLVWKFPMPNRYVDINIPNNVTYIVV